MPDLDFEVTGVDSAVGSIAPLLHFAVRITNSPADEKIEALLLNSQIQLQPAQRSYTAGEQEKLVELFGSPENWGQTLRNRLWTNSSVTSGSFSGETEIVLPVPCTYDLNVGATKYFCALDQGEASLLFLFSGSVFYRTPDGRLQVSRISWNKECVFRMPAQSWHAVMERQYPNTAWLTLQRDIFERLCDFKRRLAIPTWDETLSRLLENSETYDASGEITRTEPMKQVEAVA